MYDIVWGEGISYRLNPKGEMWGKTRQSPYLVRNDGDRLPR